MTSPFSSRRAGLSLIEVLVAITLSAVLLGGLSFHLFALTSAWQAGTDHDFFEQHVEGVTFFLNQSFAQSEVVEGEEDENLGAPFNLACAISTQDLFLTSLRGKYVIARVTVVCANGDSKGPAERVGERPRLLPDWEIVACCMLPSTPL